MGNHKKYFKVLSCDESVESDWLEAEFKAGRLRVGWSWPGSDLNQLKAKPNPDCTEDQLITWRKTQFLINRLHSGDRVVCQFRRPLREFWLGEVIDEGYEFENNGRADFNHIMHVKALAKTAIPISSKFVPIFLKHDLSKRGNYYEIYPEESVGTLDRICSEALWDSPDLDNQRQARDEFLDAHDDLVRKTVALIHRRWPKQEFEVFCENLCKRMNSIEVHSKQDTREGWDLLIRILDPITKAILHDRVPVQCKNYEGAVTIEDPINNLERCIRNSNSDNAYLFILGDITDEFMDSFERRQVRLSNELKKKVTFHLVDQEAIAEWYLGTLGNF